MRTNRIRGLLALLASVSLATTLAPAHANPDEPPRDLGNLADYVTPRELKDDVHPTGRWFVELQTPPTTSGGKATRIASEQAKFESDQVALGIDADIVTSYNRLFNGVVVKADDAAVARLDAMPNVKAVYPVLSMRAPAEPTAISVPNLSSLEMIGADKAHSELGLNGEGIKVAIIDSGVDYDHPDLGGSGEPGGTAFPTERVAYGYDFVGDDYDPIPGDGQMPAPDNNPDDCDGHGTHVAGTVAASGTVTGVAPNATLGAYRVLSCAGATDTQIILDAMERVAADGMDVANMSLGWPFVIWPDYPLSQAADRMVDAGVILVVAAGNEGDFGEYSMRSPGVADKVISVASYDTTAIAQKEIIFTPTTGEPIATTLIQAGTIPFEDGFTGELALFTDPLACQVDPGLEGKVVFFDASGGCSIDRRAQLASESGAVGFVAVAEALGEYEVDSPIPGVGIRAVPGQQVRAALSAGPVTVTVPGTLASTPAPGTPGLLSYFTSWGLTADLTLKPDLGAPGGNVYSTMPLELVPHATMSGTSMASPHVAGAVALLLDDDPTLTAAEVRSKLQNTATPTQFSFMPDSGVLDAAHRQGAGLIHVDRAATTEALVTPSKISTRGSSDGPHTEVLTIANRGSEPVTWDLSYRDAVSSSTFFEGNTNVLQPDLTQLRADVDFSADSVTVAPGGSATVSVTIAAPASARIGTIYSGFVFLTAGDQRVPVPFAGLVGELDDLPTLVDFEGNPGFGKLTCDIWAERICGAYFMEWPVDPYGEIFGLETSPVIAAQLAMPTPKVTLEVLSADDDDSPVEATKQLVVEQEFVGRDPWGLALPWDGQLVDESGELAVAPHGRYILRLTIASLAPSGEPTVYDSPAFQWLEAPEPEPSPSPTPSPSPSPTVKPIAVDVYSTPGLHEVNGRRWYTTCEPYSQTTRCRTNIWATVVNQVNGRFVASTGWAFNNLTYLPLMTRKQWANNPLGKTGSWTAADGRKWRTECDTAATGRNGCRNYAVARVIESTPKAGGGYTYQWVTKEIMNSIVRFK